MIINNKEDDDQVTSVRCSNVGQRRALSFSHLM